MDMQACLKLVSQLPVHTMPENYGWEDDNGDSPPVVLLTDVGFKNVSDGLHKEWGEYCLPKDFDNRLFLFGKKGRSQTKLMRVDPERVVVAQRFLDRNHLIRNIKHRYCQTVKLLQCGDYYVVRDGHHRLAACHLMNKAVLVKVRRLYLERE